MVQEKQGFREFETKEASDMDGLPRELCINIFHLLDHQSLASAPQGLFDASSHPNMELEKHNFSFSATLNFPYWSKFLMSP
jgi:hypothetical protein